MAFEKEYEGIKITVNQAGKFTATVNGKQIARASLGAVEKYIAENATAVPIIAFSRPSGLHIKVDQIIRESRGKLKSETDDYHGWETVIEYDPQLYEKAMDIKDRHDALIKEVDALIKRGVRVRSDNLSLHRETARQRYPDGFKVD